MRIFPSFVRRVVQVITGGGNGFIASVINWGVAFANQIRLIGAQNIVGFGLLIVITALFSVAPAVAATMIGAAGITLIAKNVGIKLTNRIALTTTQLPGIRHLIGAMTWYGTAVGAGVLTALLGVVGVIGLFNVQPALALGAVIRSYLTPQTPAAEIVQITYDLTQRKGANSASEANGPCGRQDFDTTANAVGVHDGTVATCAGNALAARCGRLNMGYAATLGKTELTITQVNLHFYYAQTSVISGSSSGGYTLGGGDTELFSHGALTSPDFLTTPNSFDITAAIGGDWANVDAIQTYVIADIGAVAIGDQVEVDAVELEVIATATQIV